MSAGQEGGSGGPPAGTSIWDIDLQDGTREDESPLFKHVRARTRALTHTHSTSRETLKVIISQRGVGRDPHRSEVSVPLSETWLVLCVQHLERRLRKVSKVV